MHYFTTSKLIYRKGMNLFFGIQFFSVRKYIEDPNVFPVFSFSGLHATLVKSQEELNLFVNIEYEWYNIISILFIIWRCLLTSLTNLD